MKKAFFSVLLLFLFALLLTTNIFAADGLTAERTSYGMEVDPTVIQNTDGVHLCTVYDENGRMLAVEEFTADDNVVYCDVNAVLTVRVFALAETSLIPLAAEAGTTLEAPEAPIHVHTWDNGTMADEPNCNSEGLMVYTCTAADCNVTPNATYTETLARTDHTWSIWQRFDNEYHIRTCTVFDFHTETAPHNFELREIISEPTTEQEGSAIYYCPDCRIGVQRPIPKLEPKDVWFTYDADRKEYVLNWLPADELASGDYYHVNGNICYPSQRYYPTQSLYISLSQLNLDPAELTVTTDIVISTGQPYSGTLNTLYTIEDAIVVAEGETANFTLTGQTDGTYLVGADTDLTGMTVQAKLIHDDGETELVTETYDTPYINIYPWDGSTIELTAMICTLSEDTEHLNITRTPAKAVTEFSRPATPAGCTVTTAEELQTALTVGGKVTLGGDISAGSMYIYGGEPVTLDLNGHTLKANRLRFDYGKEATIIGTCDGSAIAGSLYANNADKLTILGGSYGPLSCSWINNITLENAAFTSAEYTTLSIYDFADINNAMNVNRGDDLSIENSTLTTSAVSSDSFTRYEALTSTEVETIRLVNVTASSVSGSAVELSAAPAYGSSGELYAGSSAYVRGGSYTSQCTNISAAALQIEDFDTVEVGGVIDPVNDPDDLQISSACHGLELTDVSGAITLSDITAQAIGEGTSQYNLFYIHNLETGGTVTAIRLTGIGGRANTIRVEDRTSLTLEKSTFTASAAGYVPAAISIERVGKVTIDNTDGFGGYYGLYIFDCADVDLSNMVLRDSRTFALLANNCTDFDVNACEIYGPMRFDKNGTYRFTGGSWLHGSVSAYGNSLEEFVTVVVDSTCIGVESTSTNSYAVIDRQN